ncbi:MAG: bifunctional UDP-N-acetylglucosamine diphosphorylase/glucosamine-1-phosphate N-acetyltransferase GlmU [Endomicrobium sp.]|jgi:bifunctional UDP-N-acetylglucosamine pyrophosphorylase/glucosamine-1-phosphate N-acetyltransferase|nr:bifunctional UDP-N-acetylglucosamine diphosphorylase/glucosamine-1-phosphate N-acetyltransferase GlmU [Endomicrobium sp.]
MNNFSAVILAAGPGTRMLSSLPKVMHKLSGKPLLRWVLDSVVKLKPDSIVIVLGYKANVIKDYLLESNFKNIKFVYQEKQLGTAHAVMQTEEIFKNYDGSIVVVNGDVPLIKSSTLMSLVKNNKKNEASVTVLSAKIDNPFGYGRIVRENGFLERIVEEKDATILDKRIKEVNSGIYCFDKSLWKSLLEIKSNNAKKEYYITDTIAILKRLGKKVSLVMVKDESEIKGINSREELLQTEDVLRAKKVNELLNAGVTILDAKNVYVSYDAKIGRETVIYPGVFIDVGVSIGEGCVIKGASYILNSRINKGSVILYSYIEGASIEANVKIGPFANIRYGTVLKENVKIGNFSEIKNSVIAKNSKINHLSYIGDAQIGKNVNIGAGTITCNYDGVNKYRTIIGENAFIGSNVNFVAPVEIGREALIAAGSTITCDVPSKKLAIARAKQEIKRKRF